MFHGICQDDCHRQRVKKGMPPRPYQRGTPDGQAAKTANATQ